ncbi:MAG: PilZ domain-containing protein [Magnetospirillum sp.]|nr:PilZ domain-containing protein [Magnetospirillum sp.]
MIGSGGGQDERLGGMPEQDGQERRRYPRFNGLGLMANIGGKLVRVAGISAGGMNLEAGFAVAAGSMRFTLYPTENGKVDINHGIGGACRLVREGERLVALRFDPATYRLVKFIAECSGAGPDRDSFLSR